MSRKTKELLAIPVALVLLPICWLGDQADRLYWKLYDWVHQ